MTLEYMGVTIDTDKPVYVMGYTILKSWFPFRRNKTASNFGFDGDCKISMKQFMVHEIVFAPSHLKGTQHIEKINLRVCGKHFDSLVNLSECAFGVSITNCRENFKTMFRKELEKCAQTGKNVLI